MEVRLLSRNRKKHKKKEKIISYSLKNLVQEVEPKSTPGTENSIKKSSMLDWSKIKIIPSRRGRKGPLYV